MKDTTTSNVKIWTLTLEDLSEAMDCLKEAMWDQPKKESIFSFDPKIQPITYDEGDFEFRTNTRFWFSMNPTREVKVQYMFHRKKRINKKWAKKYFFIKRESYIVPMVNICAAI